MPRPLRFPSRVEPLTFPVFGMSWYGDPSNGTSYRAYTGGGGSARTGVFNSIVVQDMSQLDEMKISTGDLVGIALQIYQNPISKKVWLLVSLGRQVRRYSLPDGKLRGVLHVTTSPEMEPAPESPEMEKESCNAIAVNAMTDRIALGCESGLIQIYEVFEDNDEKGRAFGDEPLVVCQGHTKTVCALNFSLRNARLVSSAKDGTARVWNVETGNCLEVLPCKCEDQAPPNNPKKRPLQILVRGCAFLDMDGKAVVCVASARKGKAFLFQFIQQQQRGEQFQCTIRTDCSNFPISAMSLSQDAKLLALGSVNGSIILWNIDEWKALKRFEEVHDLPVTCIAVRPYPVPLQGEDDGVTVHAVSASADSQLALLTMQRRAPKRKDDLAGSGGGDGSWLVLIHRLLWTSVFLWVLSPIAQEAVDKCQPAWTHGGIRALGVCVKDDVLIAPSWRAGVSSPPY